MTWKRDTGIHTEPRKPDRTEVAGENGWSLQGAKSSEMTPEETCGRGSSRWKDPEGAENVGYPRLDHLNKNIDKKLQKAFCHGSLNSSHLTRKLPFRKEPVSVNQGTLSPHVYTSPSTSSVDNMLYCFMCLNIYVNGTVAWMPLYNSSLYSFSFKRRPCWRRRSVLRVC